MSIVELLTAVAAIVFAVVAVAIVAVVVATLAVTIASRGRNCDDVMVVIVVTTMTHLCSAVVSY